MLVEVRDGADEMKMIAATNSRKTGDSYCNGKCKLLGGKAESGTAVVGKRRKV